MVPLTDTLAIAAFGAAIGAFLACATPLILTGSKSAAHWTGALLMLGGAAHGADWLGMRISGTHGQQPPVWIFSIAAAGFFWAFVRACFEDRHEPAWRRLLPAALMACSALVAVATSRPDWRGAWLVYNGLVLASLGHALWILIQGRSNDLVEGRRQMRIPLLVSAVGYISLMQISDVVQILGGDFAVPALVQAAALLALGAGAAGMLYQPDAAILAPAAPAQGLTLAPEARQSPGLDPLDQALAARLNGAMDQEQLWRDEHLTIGGLAQRLGAPEHRLRSLINAQLGHRNFAAFVNAHRIEAAKHALADPENGRKPVSSIAFELGFGSLGPFNRAFKESTGQTPTAWRQAALQALAESKRA